MLELRLKFTILILLLTFLNACSQANETSQEYVVKQVSSFAVIAGKVSSVVDLETHVKDHQDIIGVMDKWQVNFSCDYTAEVFDLKETDLGDSVYGFNIVLSENCSSRSSVLEQLAQIQDQPTLGPSKNPVSYHVMTDGEIILLLSHSGLPTKLTGEERTKVFKKIL